MYTFVHMPFLEYACGYQTQNQSGLGEINMIVDCVGEIYAAFTLDTNSGAKVLSLCHVHLCRNVGQKPQS